MSPSSRWLFLQLIMTVPATAAGVVHKMRELELDFSWVDSLAAWLQDRADACGGSCFGSCCEWLKEKLCGCCPCGGVAEENEEACVDEEASICEASGDAAS